MNPGQFNEFMGELRAIAEKLDRLVDAQAEGVSLAKQQQANTAKATEVFRSLTEQSQIVRRQVEAGKQTDTTSPVEKTDAEPGKPAVEVVDEVLTPDKAKMTTKATKTADTDSKMVDPAKGTKKGK